MNFLKSFIAHLQKPKPDALLQSLQASANTCKSQRDQDENKRTDIQTLISSQSFEDIAQVINNDIEHTMCDLPMKPTDLKNETAEDNALASISNMADLFPTIIDPVLTYQETTICNDQDNDIGTVDILELNAGEPILNLDDFEEFCEQINDDNLKIDEGKLTQNTAVSIYENPTYSDNTKNKELTNDSQYFLKNAVELTHLPQFNVNTSEDFEIMIDQENKNYTTLTNVPLTYEVNAVKDSTATKTINEELYANEYTVKTEFKNIYQNYGKAEYSIKDSDECKANDNTIIMALTVPTNRGADAKNDISKDIDIISISSDDLDGYHSSDFEFITEEEAKMDGLIINFRPKHDEPVHKFKSEVYTVEIAKDYNYSSSQDDNDCQKSIDYPKNLSPKLRRDKSTHPIVYTNKNKTIQLAQPSNQFNKESYRRAYIKMISIDAEKRKETHRIPKGEEYLSLFQEIYSPTVSNLCFLENKSVIPATSMRLDYKGVGQDMNVQYVIDDNENELKQEVNESIKKIQDTYPRENRKRRRRN